MHTVAQTAPGKPRVVHLTIPIEQAGLLRQVLSMTFRSASKCSDPALFGGTGVLQRAVRRLHRSVNRQLRQIEGGNT